MAPDITIEEIDPDYVVVEGQRIERKSCSRSNWLKFWHDQKRRSGTTLADVWNSGYEARSYGSPKTSNPY